MPATPNTLIVDARLVNENRQFDAHLCTGRALVGTARRQRLDFER